MSSSPKRPASGLIDPALIPAAPTSPNSSSGGVASQHTSTLKKPRRNPALSCQLCRIKKIKCSRVFPCSNCVTRNVECVPQDGNAMNERVWTPRLSRAEQQPQQRESQVGPSPVASSGGATGAMPGTPSPLAMVSAVGAQVAGNPSPMSSQYYSNRYLGDRQEPSPSVRTAALATPGPESKPPRQQRSYDSTFRVDSDDAMNSASGINMLSLVASREAQIQDRDSLKTANLLEELSKGNSGRYNTERPLPPPVEIVSRGEAPSKQKFVRDTISPPYEPNGSHVSAPSPAPSTAMDPPPPIRPIAIPRHAYHENSLSRAHIYDASEPHALSRIRSRLPPENDAILLAENFMDVVHPMHHILHEQTFHMHLKELYANYHNLDTEAFAGSLSLVFAVLAVGAHFWQSGRPGGLDMPPSAVSQLSRSLRESAIECLSAANFMSCPTLETIQTCVLLPLIQSHSPHDPDSFRNMSGAVVRMAQSLGLHRLGSLPRPGENRINFELQRRLWWYITMNDWLDATTPGPLHGTYLISSNQSRTSYPIHIDDDDLLSHDQIFPHPNDHPTSMSYYLSLLNLSSIAREFVDAVSPPFHPSSPSSHSTTSSGTGGGSDDYDAVLSVDAQFRSFQKNLPPFFQSKSAGFARGGNGVFGAIDHTHAGFISAQRTLLQLRLHDLLLRLHSSYIVRGAIEPKYAYSRVMVIRSAHTILSNYRRYYYPSPSNSHDVESPIPQQWMPINRLLLAILILSIDYATTRDDDPHADETQRSVLQGCELIEQARNGHAAVDNVVRNVLGVVGRWKEDVAGRIHGYNGVNGEEGEGEGTSGASTPRGGMEDMGREVGGRSDIGAMGDRRVEEVVMEWGPEVGNVGWWEWSGLVAAVEEVMSA